MKTLVIGLDAATWDHLDELVGTGELPTFDRLLDDGVRGDLESTMPPMTPLAWPSMLTGVNPGKHGLFDFFELDAETYELATTDISGLDQPALWDVFEAEGVDAGFFNVPVAFPPPSAGEFFVSGIPSEVGQGITRPPGLEADLADAGFEVQPDLTAEDGLDRYFEAVRDHTETQGEVLGSLLDDHDLDHLWTIFMGLDWAQHYLWNHEVDGENAIDLLYRRIDGIVGDVLDRVDDDVTVMLVSDHGARPIQAEVHLNSVLEQWGYLETVDDAPDSLVETVRGRLVNVGWSVGKALPRPLRQAIKRAMPSATLEDIETEMGVGHETMVDEIDWENTSAFAYGYMGRVFVHGSDRYEAGQVPAEEYESVRSELAEKLRSLTHPETGEPLVERVVRPEEVYEGDHARDGADLIAVPTDWSATLYGDFDDEWVHPPERRIADHDPDGVLVVSGPDQSPTEVSADVTDVAPTLLALHGLPTVESMDGEVIDAVVEDADSVPTAPADRYAVGSGGTGRAADDEDAARERLEDLGYL